MTKKNKKGFTLTELIVVIAIIAILAAVLIPTSISFIKKAKISNDNQDARNMNQILQIYMIENGITDHTNLEAPDVVYIVQNIEPKYTFEPKYKDGVFFYDQEAGEIKYDSLGLEETLHAASEPSSVEDIYGTGKLYLNQSGDIAAFLNKLRSVTSQEYYSSLKNSVSDNTTLTNLINYFNPNYTVYLNASSGFNNLTEPAKHVVFAKGISSLSPNGLGSINLANDVKLILPYSVVFIETGALTMITGNNDIVFTNQKVVCETGSFSSTIKQANGINEVNLNVNLGNDKIKVYYDTNTEPLLKDIINSSESEYVYWAGDESIDSKIKIDKKDLDGVISVFLSKEKIGIYDVLYVRAYGKSGILARIKIILAANPYSE